jgi:chromosome segregation ATPase
VRIFTAIMVATAVLATAVVSVRLHLQVAGLRYRVSGLEGDRARTEREMRQAQAELEAAKAPRRLMERWAELHGESASVAATERQGRGATSRTSIERSLPADKADGASDVRPVDRASDEVPSAERVEEKPPEKPVESPSDQTPDEADGEAAR